MKARVKATGDIIEINEYCSYTYAENYDKSYNLIELEFLDVKKISLPKDEPDYWEKLRHQYAGMAMQGILANCNHQLWEREANSKGVAKQSYEIATALVNRLKEEEK